MDKQHRTEFDAALSSLKKEELELLMYYVWGYLASDKGEETAVKALLEFVGKVKKKRRA